MEGKNAGRNIGGGAPRGGHGRWSDRADENRMAGRESGRVAGWTAAMRRILTSGDLLERRFPTAEWAPHGGRLGKRPSRGNVSILDVRGLTGTSFVSFGSDRG